MNDFNEKKTDINKWYKTNVVLQISYFRLIFSNNWNSFYKILVENGGRPFKVMALVKLRISRVEPRDKMVKVYNLFYSGRMPI